MPAFTSLEGYRPRQLPGRRGCRSGNVGYHRQAADRGHGDRVPVRLRRGCRDEGGGGGCVPEFFKPEPGWQQDDREDHADSEQRR